MVKKIVINNDDDRKSRGQTQKIFLVMTHNIDNNSQRSYDVMGTTGNVYTVCIKQSPTCTCPDYKTRYRRCKHIYFVLTRIMKVKKEEEDIKEYSNDQIVQMFVNIPDITNNLVVNKNIADKYKQLKLNPNGEVIQKVYKNTEDLCPICLDDIDNGEDISYCKYTCGNNIHTYCFDIYYKNLHSEKKCFFCQKNWNKNGNANAEYINLEA